MWFWKKQVFFLYLRWVLTWVVLDGIAHDCDRVCFVFDSRVDQCTGLRFSKTVLILRNKGDWLQWQRIHLFCKGPTHVTWTCWILWRKSTFENQLLNEYGKLKDQFFFRTRNICVSNPTPSPCHHCFLATTRPSCGEYLEGPRGCECSKCTQGGPNSQSKWS